MPPVLDDTESDATIVNALQSIATLLQCREEDFDTLRQMHLEWLQFQSTLTRLVHMIDGNGRPPLAERIVLLEQHTHRLEQLISQIDEVKFRLIGLLIGVVLSLVAALFACLR
ncbi:MAG: hypothetical protein R3B90_05590 [Planctomycetaceae bacterium]